MKPILMLMFAALLACARGEAAVVTTYFTANVPANHIGPLLNGAELRGSYTYQSSTPDAFPGNQTFGDFANAVLGMQVYFPYLLTTSKTYGGYVQIFNNSPINNQGPFLDSLSVYGAGTAPLVLQNPANAFGGPYTLIDLGISLRQTQAGSPPSALLTDSLPASPPNYVNFAEHDLTLTLADMTGQSTWHIPLTYLSNDPIVVPEPAAQTLLLIAAMCLLASRRLQSKVT